MTTLHALLRLAHIATGTVGLLAGVAAMVTRKGGTAHARIGQVFWVSMTVMAAVGTLLSLAPELDRLNVTGGTVTLYLVLTAWLTVARTAGRVGSAERWLAGAGALAVVMIGGFAVRLAATPSEAGDLPPLVVFGSMLALAVLGDVRLIRRGGLRGRARTTRHLWRMCTAMLLATVSLFLGQPQVFPAALRASGLLVAPPALVLLALLYFVARERLWPRLTRRRTSPSPTA